MPIKSEVNALAHQELGNVFQLSRGLLLVVLFAKTNSPYYKLAVNIASGASVCRVHDIEKLPVHLCGFARTPEESARATALLGYVESWASTQVFVSGRMAKPTDLHRLLATLRCYQSSASCSNPDAHCLTVTDQVFMPRGVGRSGGAFQISVSLDPKATAAPPKRFVMPCKMAYRPNSLQKAHPASWRDQVQAQAVEAETDWCPRYDQDRFRQYD